MTCKTHRKVLLRITRPTSNGFLKIVFGWYADNDATTPYKTPCRYLATIIILSLYVIFFLRFPFEVMPKCLWPTIKQPFTIHTAFVLFMVLLRQYVVKRFFYDSSFQP